MPKNLRISYNDLIVLQCKYSLEYNNPLFHLFADQLMQAGLEQTGMAI